MRHAVTSNREHRRVEKIFSNDAVSYMLFWQFAKPPKPFRLAGATENALIGRDVVTEHCIIHKVLHQLSIS
jgi:hypothetical protein